MRLKIIISLKNNITIPVTNLNVRYKASAKLDDNIVIETYISKISPITITFTQMIKSEDMSKTFISAEVEVVAITNEGKLYRRLPDILRNACEKYMEA